MRTRAANTEFIDIQDPYRLLLQIFNVLETSDFMDIIGFTKKYNITKKFTFKGDTMKEVQKLSFENVKTKLTGGSYKKPAELFVDIYAILDDVHYTYPITSHMYVISEGLRHLAQKLENKYVKKIRNVKLKKPRNKKEVNERLDDFVLKMKCKIDSEFILNVPKEDVGVSSNQDFILKCPNDVGISSEQGFILKVPMIDVKEVVSEGVKTYTPDDFILKVKIKEPRRRIRFFCSKSDRDDKTSEKLESIDNDKELRDQLEPKYLYDDFVLKVKVKKDEEDLPILIPTDGIVMKPPEDKDEENLPIVIPSDDIVMKPPEDKEEEQTIVRQEVEYEEQVQTIIPQDKACEEQPLTIVQLDEACEEKPKDPIIELIVDTTANNIVVDDETDLPRLSYSGNEHQALHENVRDFVTKKKEQLQK
jgi:hypothetical protein